MVNPEVFCHRRRSRRGRVGDDGVSARGHRGHIQRHGCSSSPQARTFLVGRWWTSCATLPTACRENLLEVATRRKPGIMMIERKSSTKKKYSILPTISFILSHRALIGVDACRDFLKDCILFSRHCILENRRSTQQNSVVQEIV